MPSLTSAFKARLLEASPGYSLFQAPFAVHKIAPILADPDARRACRVLDVGCGPGTNTAHFGRMDYVGVDVSERYIRSARRRHRRTFFVADVSRPFVRDVTFDCILSNSLLHHLDDRSVRATLRNLRALLASDGHLHVLDLVLPKSWSVAYVLAKSDRGDFPRSLNQWRELLCQYFEPVVCSPYALGFPGVPLWHMVYFKGRPKTQ